MTDIETGDGGAKARMQTAALRALFALSLGWAFLFPVAAIVEGSYPVDGNPFVRDGTSLLAASSFAFLTSALAHRFFPSFLHLSHSVPAAFMVTRTLLFFPLVFLVLAVFFSVIEYVNLKATGDPTNPQHGLSVLFVALWYPALLTPAATTYAVWLAAKRPRS